MTHDAIRALGVHHVLLALLVALALMLVEQRLSQANARRLRRLGAIEAPDDIYRTVQWVYPACFVALAVEGLVRDVEPGWTTWIGLLVFAAAKALKAWVIVALGMRWTYRVLVLPGAPLVTTGPYAWMRHPNYAAVIGELIGMALLAGAPVMGPVAVVGYGALLRRRAAAEERGLGVAP